MEKNIFSFSFLSVLILVFVFISCNKDGSDDYDKPFDINKAIGTWRCFQSTDTYQGQTYQDLIYGKTITIKSDGTYTSTASSLDNTGTYSVNGNIITLKSNGGDRLKIYASINNDKMMWEGTSSTGATFKYNFERYEDVTNGSNDLCGIWYEKTEKSNGEQIVRALKISASFIWYNEDSINLLKDNPGKFFSVVDSLFYKTEGNVIYGFYNGKKLEYTRTVYNLSENKETLYLKGYFNGTFEVWDGTSTSEKDYSSYPPTWKGFLFTFNGLEVNPRTGIFAGDKIAVTAQQDQKGHLINATTYNWEVTAPILS